MCTEDHGWMDGLKVLEIMMDNSLPLQYLFSSDTTDKSFENHSFIPSTINCSESWVPTLFGKPAADITEGLSSSFHTDSGA